MNDPVFDAEQIVRSAEARVIKDMAEAHERVANEAMVILAREQREEGMGNQLTVSQASGALLLRASGTDGTPAYRIEGE